MIKTISCGVPKCPVENSGFGSIWDGPRNSILVRIIEYTFDDPGRPGSGEQHRLLTTLLDRANESNLQVLDRQELRNSVTSYTKLQPLVPQQLANLVRSP